MSLQCGVAGPSGAECVSLHMIHILWSVYMSLHRGVAGPSGTECVSLHTIYYYNGVRVPPMRSVCPSILFRVV